jgi:hypothetical protein
MATIAERLIRGDNVKRLSASEQKRREERIRSSSEIIAKNPLLRSAIIRNAEGISKNLTPEQIENFIKGDG